MKSNIIKKEISKEFILENNLNLVLEDKFINMCLDNNAWIAGGFARKVANLLFKIGPSISEEENLFSPIVNYLIKGGDVDVFTTCKENLDKIENKFSKGDFKKDVYASPFAVNLTPEINPNNIFEIYESKKNHTRFTIQMINKFFFKNIKDCFDSFDIINCKYAIEKIKNKHYLVYEEKAVKDDIKGVINICHTNSPFLGNRIYKYCLKHDLKLDNSEANLKMLRDFLFKILVNDWPKMFKFYNEKNFSSLTVKNIHKIKKLSVNDLTLFIGKFNHYIHTKVPDAYGYYINTEIVDWASKEIQDRSKLNSI